MNIKKLIALSLLSIVITGCGSTKLYLSDIKESKGTKLYLSDFKEDKMSKRKLNIEDVNVPTDFYLVNKTWLLTKINDESLANNITVTMKFQQGFNITYPVMLSGKSACNSYTTDIKIDEEENNILLSNEFTITKKHCFEENVMEMESEFVNLLKENKKIFRKNQQELVLVNKNGKKFLFSQI